jgi:hypothetical protein
MNHKTIINTGSTITPTRRGGGRQHRGNSASTSRE